MERNIYRGAVDSSMAKVVTNLTFCFRHRDEQSEDGCLFVFCEEALCRGQSILEALDDSVCEIFSCNFPALSLDALTKALLFCDIKSSVALALLYVHVLVALLVGLHRV